MKNLRIFILLGFCIAAVTTSTAFGGTQRTVTVAMKDPGCHWFLVAGKYEKSLTVRGPVSLLNVDEAALKVHTIGLDAVHGTRLDAVGSRLALAKGRYRITMVGQAPDDNHLLLTVR